MGVMAVSAVISRFQVMAAGVRWRGIGTEVARTALFNAASTAAAGLSGLLVARVLGPAVRGEYAAITAWFGMVLMLGDLGQPAALCFYVAHDPARARSYVATSRAMMLATGAAVATGGLLVSPLLARGNPQVTDGYRIVFATSLVAFVAASYTFSLQARDLGSWNVVRLAQPVLGLITMSSLWIAHLLTLDTALLMVTLSMVLQLLLAHRCCRGAGLAPGRADLRLVRPLAGYGVAQMAALTPAALNARLDQLVLSQTVPPADLGRYAVAVSVTMLPGPLVAAVGYVAFPKLAARQVITQSMRRLQWLAIVGSALLAVAALLPLDLVAPWAVPRIFGPAYRGAVPLIWLLTPGAIFLACGQVVGDLLRGWKRPAVVARAQGIAAVATVGLLVVLLPLAGIWGAAIASALAYGIATTVMIRSLRRLGAASPPECSASGTQVHQV